ncbi:hypothetical protein roselon_01124 [Roseibacterium elongatum DSM 19469]|uniref:Peptidase inhibitor I78 family protein n=1 Tax=Roseicyclus elongatus DSM 19469 TaxID=1294273 RepID=W8S413_9RHOB|nr:I78 family peptidase inhibitor [Roseibacterium elongatum]AHM03521.1 hypothetical protein roselon_01124 [Roseibacterium elongatum DSM 19469]
MRLLPILMASLLPTIAFANGDPARGGDTAADTCGAAQYAHLLGQPHEEAEALTFDGPVRIFSNSQPVTMDYLPHRINFQYDESGMIRRIYCG